MLAKDGKPINQSAVTPQGDIQPLEGPLESVSSDDKTSLNYNTLRGLPVKPGTPENDNFRFNQELREIRENYENLLQVQETTSRISFDAIFTTDKDLVITSWNPASEALFGWQAAEILGKSASQEIRSRILNILKNDQVICAFAEKGNWTGEVDCSRKDGTTVKALASLSVIWNSAGNFNGIIAVFHDISRPAEKVSPWEDQTISRAVKQCEELSRTNRILQQELMKHKQTALLPGELTDNNHDLVDNIKLGIFRCTPGSRGKFLEVNKAMEVITGYTRDELLDLEVCELYSSLDGQIPITHEVNLRDWKVTRELKVNRKDGTQIVAAVTIVAIRMDSGATRYFDGILEDITERKQAQQQIQDSLQRLQKTIKEIIQAMAYIGEVRDPYTAGHQKRVAQLCDEIGHIMGLGGEQFEGLTMASFVHDIGKILVPADILSKPGKLTKPEFDMLKDHSRIGYEILKTIEFPWPIATIVLQHHERLDGSGYPSGLSGDEIILEARILAVADVVEAMSSHRPYRPALGIQRALKEIHQNRGTLYDPQVVDACIKLFSNKGYDLR